MIKANYKVLFKIFYRTKLLFFFFSPIEQAPQHQAAKGAKKRQNK
jgi:hypothetical protein